MALKGKKVPVELKLMVPVELKLKVPAKLKSLGWPSDIGDTKCKCKKVSGTKMELNFSGTKIPGEQKIAAEVNLGGGPLGDGDPKSKCKEVSRTKMQQKFAAKLKL